ncbi:TIR domain-containing protein [Candidatus Reidiella endopervernicosa]|uniref:Toll/interleukin-1 receptor domain-containing protein n=1 Tax=Candidatus Reidiella endopervernicosa TaxID=2738883 RepID=A0A6N0HTN6_9GAMM|nr:TIR domain-containing protein [Candidatus Reidiella endopervernicosa]QKQ25768.1 toll/interleukin-1 receptor domain-containing protein [Candidatus Reidiella endopervernicosa]
MSSAFISYSTKDEELAKKLYSLTSMAGIEMFLAGISIEPGSKWTDVIFEKLDKADWVSFWHQKRL